MTNTTLPTLTSANAVSDNDLFIIRRVGQTSDQQIYARMLLAYVTAAMSAVSVTADQITDASTLGKALLRAASTAAAQNALGGTVVGKALFESATTAVAQNTLGGTTFGKAIFQATSTAAAQNLLEAGAAGLNVFKAVTTAAIGNIIGVVSAGFATSAQATAGTSDGTYMSPVLTRNAIEKFAFTSANFSSSAQATAGTSDGTIMSPVNVRNAIEKFALTSANFSTSAQATAGTSNGSVMTPNGVRNAIEKFALTSANAATTAQATAGSSDGAFMTPVATRHEIEKFAFTSANYATTAQANAGTDATTVMNPVLTKNAIASLGGSGGITVIASANLATGSPSVVDFTGIPQTYRGIKLTIRNASNSVATRALRVTIDNGLGLGNAGNDAITKEFSNANSESARDQESWGGVTQTAAQKTSAVLELHGYQSAVGIQIYRGWFTTTETVDDTFTNNVCEFVEGILTTGAVARYGAVVGIRITWDNVATGVFDGGIAYLEGFN